MKKDFNIIDFFIRYLIILLTGLGNLYIIYLILTPITLYTTFILLNLFGEIHLFNNSFWFNNNIFVLVPACIGGSAYYLLLILNLSTPDIKLSTRIKILFFSFLTLFLFNISRILLMVYIYGNKYFEIVHLTIWYILSTILVFLLWISLVKIYNIKKIPIYSDIKTLYKMIIKKPSSKILDLKNKIKKSKKHTPKKSKTKKHIIRLLISKKQKNPLFLT